MLYFDSTKWKGETDPFYAQTTVLLHMDGANDSTTIIDQKGNTVTAYGDAKLKTAEKKFGTASCLFDPAGDVLQVTGSSDFDFPASTDFTYEGWYYFNGGARQYLFDYGSSNVATLILTPSTGYIEVYTGVAGFIISQSGLATLANNEWHHIALTRSGTTWRVFFNGAQQASVTSSADFGSSSAFNIGAPGVGFGSLGMDGYLDEFRVTKGVARYTSNFSIPTKAFPNQ